MLINSMVVFFYGTTGESIKLATLVESIPEEQRLLIDTCQQPKLLEMFYRATSFPRPNFRLSNGWLGDDLTKPWQMFFWLIAVLANYFTKGTWRQLRRLRLSEPVVMIVHGDTVTTLVGAVLARLTGLQVAHVEAGLRSGTWRHPFPEELNRRMVSRLARLHYAPGEIPEAALHRENVRGTIVNTLSNTVADSALWAKRQKASGLPRLPSRFTLVSVHRNELLVSARQLKGLLGALNEYAQRHQIVFLDHPITTKRISALNCDSLLDHPNIKRVPKQNYVNMMHLIDGADVIITDSGGLQEEAYYLGLPCIVYREATERQEGIGENVVLTGFDPARLIKELDTYQTKLIKTTTLPKNPTAIIIDNLTRNQYLD